MSLPFVPTFEINDKVNGRHNQLRRKKNTPGESAMKTVPVSRRAFLKSPKAAAALVVLSPAIIGRAHAATTKLKCSSSLPKDPKYANGRVYSDNRLKNLKAA